MMVATPRAPLAGRDMDAEETVALVARALGGGDGGGGALERLVKVLTPVIQARVAKTLLCRGRRSNNLREEVEDLTQDVFVALWANEQRELRRWRPERGLSLENFVGLIAERQTFSYLRSGRRNAWKEEPTPNEDLDRPLNQSGADEIVINKEQLELLEKRLSDRLSEQGWWMFILLFEKDLSTEEVMAVTGLTRDAVDAWRSRIRRLARELMQGLSETDGAPRKPRKDD